MAEQFYTILTAIGKAKIANSNVLGNKINLTTMAVGDGNGKYYNPVETQESLVNEVWKGNIQNISIDKDNPNWIVIEGVIPSNIGGFTVREVGLFDEDGDLLVISKYPETYKPIVENGATKDVRIRLILEVSNAANVTLKINPAVIFATKEDIENVDKKITNNKEEFNTFKTETESHLAEMATYSTYKLNPDANGIFTEIQYKRSNGTLILKSVLNGGTSPQYTTRTETEYEQDGITIKATRVYTITYDIDSKVISEVLQ